MIDRLTITNFKAFAAADLPLGPYTLLSGLNSSGKSTVLQALALLRQAFDQDMLHDPDDSAGFPLNGDLVQLGTGRDVLHEDYVAKQGRGARDRIPAVRGWRQTWRVASALRARR